MMITVVKKAKEIIDQVQEANMNEQSTNKCKNNIIRSICRCNTVEIEGNRGQMLIILEEVSSTMDILKMKETDTIKDKEEINMMTMVLRTVLTLKI